MDVDFEVKNTGEKKDINGFSTTQSIMTITVREKGKTLQQSGGMVLTSDIWLTPSVPALKEIADFQMKYRAEALRPDDHGRVTAGHGLGHGDVPDDEARAREDGGRRRQDAGHADPHDHDDGRREVRGAGGCGKGTGQRDQGGARPVLLRRVSAA